MRPLGKTLTAALLLSLATGAEASSDRRLDLPAGRLGDAIVALGRQAGVSIGISDTALAGQKVPALRGRMSVEDALKRLLEGRDARFVEVARNSFRVTRQPPQLAARDNRGGSRTATAPPAPAPEDIIVTGTLRPVLLSGYPGSVRMVLGNDSILDGEARGSGALIDRLPGVASTYLGPGRNKLFIRGIADSSFTGPTQATTGQYLGETRLNYNAPDPDLRLYDLERIEVLQGPQGTLYGAGSLGGIIRIMPNRPRLGVIEGGGALGVSLTRHGAPGADGAAMLNLPLVDDRLALRVVGYAATEGGYIDDSGRGLEDVNRVRTVGGRAAMRFVTYDDLVIDLGGAAQRISGRDAQYADRDAPPLTRDTAIDQPFSSDYLLGDLRVAKNWGDVSFVTALGAVRQRIDEQYDATLVGWPLTVFEQSTRIRLLSAESRLTGGSPDGFNWLVGGSLIDNQARQRRSFGAPGDVPPSPGVRNDIREAAAFGEASLRIVPGVTVTAGGRISHSRLSGESLDVAVAVLEPITTLQGGKADRNQTAFLPSLALAYEAAPDLLLFARYQESFRPGGLAVSDNFILRFVNDDVQSFEGGLRYGLPGIDAFDASVSLVYTRWQDIQADTIGLSGLLTTANIGDGRIYTVDFSLGWRPLPGLDLELAGVVNDSRVTNPVSGFVIVNTSPAVTDVAPRISPTDADLPNVADFSGRFAAHYEARLTDRIGLSLDAAARYTGKSTLGIGPILGREQGDWLDVSVGARLDRGAHSLALTVTNLFDTVGNRFAMGSPFTVITDQQITPLRPRTVRLGWQTRF